MAAAAVATGLRELFKSIDADSSGTITVEEMRNALQNWGHRIHEVGWLGTALLGCTAASRHVPCTEHVGFSSGVKQAWLCMQYSHVCTRCLCRTLAELWQLCSARPLLAQAGCRDPDRCACRTIALLFQAELQSLMAIADVDGDGLIDYNEFVAATMHVSKLEKEELLQRVGRQVASAAEGLWWLACDSDAVRPYSVEQNPLVSLAMPQYTVVCDLFGGAGVLNCMHQHQPWLCSGHAACTTRIP